MLGSCYIGGARKIRNARTRARPVSIVSRKRNRFCLIAPFATKTNNGPDLVYALVIKISHRLGPCLLYIKRGDGDAYVFDARVPN